MSLEIRGFNSADRSAVDEVSTMGVELAVHQGISEDQAYATGMTTAQYTAEVMFTALRSIGVIPEQGIDSVQFKIAVNTIVHQTVSR